MAGKEVFVLLAACFYLSYSQYNFGYSECTYNSYTAVCMGQFIIKNEENNGLTIFPILSRRETCVLLKNNAIERFPSDLNNLKTVVTLDISGNQLSVLPDDLTVMSTLEIMDLSRNRLTTLSPKTRFPVSLRGLLLAGNGMATLPAGLHVSGLFVLDLSGNQFLEIPEHFCVSDQLIRVDFTNNPLDHDISRYINTVNKCRNVNKIPFCLFTDAYSMQCNCSSVGPILGGTPSFCLGNRIRGQEMRCSVSGSDKIYSGRKLFDVNETVVKEKCPTYARQAFGVEPNFAIFMQASIAEMIALLLMQLLL